MTILSFFVPDMLMSGVISSLFLNNHTSKINYVSIVLGSVTPLYTKYSDKKNSRTTAVKDQLLEIMWCLLIRISHSRPYSRFTQCYDSGYGNFQHQKGDFAKNNQIGLFYSNQRAGNRNHTAHWRRVGEESVYLFKNDIGLGSRFQVQIGVRYLFN